MSKRNQNHAQEHNHTSGHSAVEPRSDWAGMLVGLLIGGLAGAVTMLLLAPQSGKRTRAALRRQSHELRDHTAETVENVEDAMADARYMTHKMSRDARKQAKKLEKRGHAVLDGQSGR